jgi:hypothetical protein
MKRVYGEDRSVNYIVLRLIRLGLQEDKRNLVNE